MKLTNPFVLLAMLVAVVIVLSSAFDLKKKPVKHQSIQVQLTDSTTTNIAISANDDTKELTDSLSELRNRDRKWKDITDLAGRTARINLTSIVMDMQEQVRENEAMPFPKCLDAAKPYWLESQRQTIAAYLEFMSRNEISATEHFQESERASRNYQMVVEACRPKTKL